MKKHAEIQITSDDGAGSLHATTSPTTITKTTIDGSTHAYYTAPNPAQNYQVSTTKYNTSGSTLIETTSDVSIQFNDFTLTIDNNDVFDNNFGIKVSPFNLYGQGTDGTGNVISTANGSNLGNFRLDTASIRTLTSFITASSSSYGIRVRSGLDTATVYYPSGPATTDEAYGDTYDETKDISLTSNPRYDTELQLVGGKFQTPGSTDGYKDYTSFYLMSGLPGTYTSYYDYSTITADASVYRFTTFKYTNLSNLGTINAIKLEFIDAENFTASEIFPTDLTVHIQLPTYTGWLDANNPIKIWGLDNSNKNINGTPVASNSGTYPSTATIKYCYLPVPSDGNLGSEIYIRIGLRMNSTKKFRCVQLQVGF